MRGGRAGAGAAGAAVASHGARPAKQGRRSTVPVRPLTPNTPLQATHQEALDNLRAAMHATSTLVATVMDTRGPEILVLNR